MEFFITKRMNYRILCEKTGIEYGSINTQRTKHALPKAEQLYIMSSLLNVTMEYLLTSKKSFDISEEYPFGSGFDYKRSRGSGRGIALL